MTDEATRTAIAAELANQSGRRISRETAERLADGLDLAAFTTADGTVDRQAVGTFAATILPTAKPTHPQHRNRARSGRRAGIDEARRRFGDPADGQDD